jgi:2-polyprenyl-6-methoxyphenol hydroxylase-like FAD-dependent oxidoreductase
VTHRRVPEVGDERAVVHRCRRREARATAAELAAEFPAPLPGLVAATEPQDVQRWVLRDRPALAQWSRGRATLVGDAAHPTSPYAAYGAGMSIEDGYLLGVALRGVDLTDTAAVQRALQSYEDPRKPHTAKQVQMAYVLGKVFHHAPAPLRPLRDVVFDHTPFLQKVAGDSNPRAINEQLALIEEEDRSGQAAG